MTMDRDLDFRLAGWLDDQATSLVPGDLLERSLARVAVTRQRPRWLVGTTDRGRSTSAVQLRILAVGAAVLAVAAIWFGGVGTGPLPRPTPSPTPLASNVPSGTGPLLPPALRGTWVGSTRTVRQLEPPTIQSALRLTFGELQYLGGGDPALSSAAVWLGGDRLTFRLSDDAFGCHRDDLGTYAFALNGTARALTLDLVRDPCTTRAAAISGPWTRAECPNTESLCLGDLDPGEHFSASFNPFVPRDAYVYDYGRLSYTVPDGWTNEVDGPDGYLLTRKVDPLGAGLYLFSTAIADSQAEGCPGTIEPGVGSDAAALSAWLTTLPGLLATTPTAVTVGGLRGFTLDLAIKPTWTRPCPYTDGKPGVPMFTNGDPVNNFDWGLVADGRMRIFLLDLPDGRTTLIDVEAENQDKWDALVADSMPVIGTFEFHP